MNQMGFRSDSLVVGCHSAGWVATVRSNENETVGKANFGIWRPDDEVKRVQSLHNGGVRRSLDSSSLINAVQCKLFLKESDWSKGYSTMHPTRMPLIRAAVLTCDGVVMLDFQRNSPTDTEKIRREPAMDGAKCLASDGVVVVALCAVEK